jgi:site-specific DNA-methyltransferase (adenine-specific)
LDVAKAIDKMAGVEFEAKPASGVGFMNSSDDGYNTTLNQLVQIGESTDEANKWKGWGTALKPAHEPIVMARKPFPKGYTVVQNVLEFGVGGLNIDGSRIPHLDEADRASATPQGRVTSNTMAGAVPDVDDIGRKELDRPDTSKGRWPANFIHDNSEEVVQLFPDTKSGTLNLAKINAENKTYGNRPKELSGEYEANSGSAARFFYCAKASKRDRNEGLNGFETKEKRYRATANGTGATSKGMERFTTQPVPNHHPTVKPTSLMQYLVRLVTPKGGVVLDPFMGSGSTGKACVYEGFNFIGIDQDLDYVGIAKARIEFAQDCKDSELPL